MLANQALAPGKSCEIRTESDCHRELHPAIPDRSIDDTFVSPSPNNLYGFALILLLIVFLAAALRLADIRLNAGFVERPLGFAHTRPFLASPVHIIVIVYVTFHCCWHMFWLMVSLPDTGTLYWHTPVFLFITLTHVERLVLVAMMLLVATEFWFRDCKSDRVRIADCLLAATEIVTLAFTMLAMPQHGK